MGGDGGVCANNRHFLPQTNFGTAQREKDKAAVDRERWTRCHYSKMPLRPPVLADAVGHLYSAEHVLGALQKKEPLAAYVKGFKDFTELHPEINDAKKDVYSSFKAGSDDGSVEDHLNLYCCPVTLQTTNGRNRFCYARKCGHVFSFRAVSEMGSDACPVCTASATTNWDAAAAVDGNVIIELTPAAEAVPGLEAAAVARKEKELAEKKKKRADGDAGQVKKKKKASTDTSSSVPLPAAPRPKKVITDVSRDKPPEGAEAAVWKSMFVDKTLPAQQTFTCRTGIRSSDQS